MSPADVEQMPMPRHGHVLGISKKAFHKVAYTEWGSPDAERVALCVHGLSRQGRDFDHLAIALAGMGYRVICPDLVGRGQSDGLVDADEYGLAQYCGDLTVLLAKTVSGPVDWIGTSLGGLVGILMASLPQSPVRRLVLNDIGPLLPWSALFRIGSYLQQMPGEFRDFAAAERYFRKVHAPFGPLTDDEWQHLTTHSIAEMENGRFRMLCDRGIGSAFRHTLLYNLNLWKYWDAITCPVLALRGETSDLFQRDTAVQMGKRGPKATVVEIPGCGHAPALMSSDQIAIVTDWLEP